MNISDSSLAAFVIAPLLASGLLLLFRGSRMFHAFVLLAVLTASLCGAGALIWLTSDGGVYAHSIGLWPGGIAIPLVADMFSSLMLAATGIITIACVAFALAAGFYRSPYFAPLVLVMVTGVNGALLTADIFNFFVFLEVMLLPAYGLYVLSPKGQGRTPRSRIAGLRLFLTVNLFTSTVFLAGVGFIYGVVGTVNIAELAGVAAENDTVALATAVCLFTLSIKSSIVPTHGWLARSYPLTTPAITALFSGIHTKVANYAIYRLYAVVFDGDETYLWIGVVFFSLTMLVGVLGAVGEHTTRSILAFHMTSQIGYIMLGVALFTELGLTAGIFYLVHHMIVKASLFLSTGALEVTHGTGRLGALPPMAKREPLLAVAFMAAALSLAGLPPFSGFVGKLALIVAAAEVGQWIAVALMVIVSLFTLLSMLKIWSGVFWDLPWATVGRRRRPADDPDGTSPTTGAHLSNGATSDTARATERETTLTLVDPVEKVTSAEDLPKVKLSLVLPSVALALITLSIGLGAEPLLAWSETAAQGLLNTGPYVEAVLTP
ncbi:NADH-ubiquinone/plastoquinone (complex I) family protein [Corynebacterium efficiens YS-314]|uniref:Putative NADH plastoquinone oxidoreductase n=1 Tax=Corynebacterium efficiens (strain DSM 44549 / YS-314 / AJ 12310 / JCM 11189 / NBRC 100395) TaxID=196164 RepID=Q8FTZ4_COREF|nr:monovalent cation/H+ antiporter subunit D family protein [Corynebacterium efficiens]EEW48855.1 NADH-ubiquinone/plastoquinone (complex I) family protein [Corynebacterium efficiens YS-314]BAC17038.1 putative NADH plastoquinone oxidoreductase [Corynebacterium efficiens YS-314]